MYAFQAREIIADGVRGDTPLTATNAEVTVKIKDVNDEPPLFNKREYFVSIPEDIPQGAALPGLDMTVKDTDSVSERAAEFYFRFLVKNKNKCNFMWHVICLRHIIWKTFQVL